MNLVLSRKEFRSLLEVLEIADWVLHAYKAEEPAETRPYRELEQKVLAMAESFGFEDLVDYDALAKRFVSSRDFGESSPAQDFVTEFENDAFWDQLAERLVERDLIRQIGEPALQKLEFDERERREDPYRRLYGEEFLAHGVDRLEILQLHSGQGSESGKLLS